MSPTIWSIRVIVRLLYLHSNGRRARGPHVPSQTGSAQAGHAAAGCGASATSSSLPRSKSLRAASSPRSSYDLQRPRRTTPDSRREQAAASRERAAATARQRVGGQVGSCAASGQAAVGAVLEGRAEGRPQASGTEERGEAWPARAQAAT